ncbi:hypothetical protein B0H17DRAFT_1041561 [Mycena rosella]|uniref:SET domain-containing protein n=1 Tax=Mycena rosella TaxID=1033263 RepID=A0AAD7E1H0_MYCRO|nr:hypothetical protein B0H17DRAFT_1041561 [Mycena rosella]
MDSLSCVPGPVFWRPTKIMNMRDLSKDDDFLSHLLVEKLGTGTVPLLVHKMDSSRRLPKTDADDLLQIVRRLVVTKGPVPLVTRQAVDELLVLAPIRYYLKQYTQKQINAFATHASRYFELYHPTGCIEIAHTSRYSHHTGKSELCILATRLLAPGTVITELKGSMANLTEEEDKELKRTDLRNSDIRRDFSVIHSKQMKKNHLFLGPARFVNHDCNNNCELFREGKYITFRVLRTIAIGEEITAHYGDGYFGRKNRHCLCETCEKRGRGGYAPDHTDEDPPISSDSESDSGSDLDSDSDSNASHSDGERKKPALNLNERRTRRGVYAVMPEEGDSDGSDNDADDGAPTSAQMDAVGGGEIELAAEVDTASDLTSLPPSRAQSNSALPAVAGPSSLPTPETPGMASPALSALTALSPAMTARSSSALTSLSSADDLPSTPKSNQSTPFRSIIATRGQKVKESSTPTAALAKQLMTPPLSEDPDTPAKRVTRSASANMLSTRGTVDDKGKGKQKASQASTPAPTPLSGTARKGKGKEELDVKKEEAEPRMLRARPSVPAAVEVTKEPPPKREILKGPDGKPLPICSTCSNVLPVISVDSKVVWGLEPSSKKKNKKQDCPRCIRHFAIYGQAWPCRISIHGPVFLLPTPREEATPVESASRRVNKKALSVLDRKLAAAAAVASASPKSRKRQREEEERPMLKRRKTEPVLRVETSKSQKTKYVKSGRHSLPGPKVLHTYGRHKRGRKPRSPSPTKSDEEPQSEEAAEEVKQVEEVVPKVRRKKKATTPQPVLSRAERAEEREKIRRWLQKKGEEEAEDSAGEDAGVPARKRSSADIDDPEDHPKRKAPRSKEKQLPLQKVLPRPSSGFRGGQLFSKPNPLSYALHAWASPLVSTASSSEDDELPPVTPEDEPTVDLPLDTCGPAFTSTPSTFKPTPFSFARRRWGSGSTPPRDDSKRRVPRNPRDDASVDEQLSDMSEAEDDNLFFRGDPPSSSVSHDSAVALGLPWCPTPVEKRTGAAAEHTDRYPSSISSLDSLSECSQDNDDSPTQRTVKHTPPCSPLQHDSDSSPLPLLRRIISPISSPLSSLDSAPASPRGEKDELPPSLGLGPADAILKGPKPVSFTSENLASSPNPEWDSFSSPLTSPVDSDSDC